jgi:hypothetical protein
MLNQPLAIATAAALLLGLPQPPRAGAELPPDVYAQDQRQAPVRLSLEIRRVQRGTPQRRPQGAGQEIPVTVEGRILAVERNRSPQTLRPGQTVTIRYNRLVMPTGFVGPSPVPIPTVGSRVTAWLQPDPNFPFLPAAGGMSFGPDLEQQPSR